MSDSSPTVVVTCLQMQDYLAEALPSSQLKEELSFHFPPLRGQQFSASEMADHLLSADYAIVGDDVITSESVSDSSIKGLIKWGIGYDSIDVEALENKGIRFSNTPGQFGPDIAELVLGMILALERGISSVDSGVRAGEWPKFRGSRIKGKKALILGFGNLGREVARLLTSVKIHCGACDPYAVDLSTTTVTRVQSQFPYDDQCDYLISCLPLTPETQGFISTRELSVLGSTGFLINVSRGGVVDEAALYSAISKGAIAGAALDVYAEEPLGLDSELRNLTGVVFGAHNGSNTEQGVREASEVALEILLGWLASEGDTS